MKARTFSFIVFLLITLPIGGCGTDSAQRIEILEQALVTAQAASDRAAESVEILQASIESYEEILSDPNLSSETAETILASLQRVQAKLELVAPAKERADLAIAEIRAKIAEIRANPSAEIDIGDELALVGSGLGAAGTAIGGDTGRWLTLAGAAITTLATILGSLGVLKGKQATAALSEVVMGVDAYKTIVDEESGGRNIAVHKDLKTAFEGQSPETRAMVAKLRPARA